MARTVDEGFAQLRKNLGMPRYWPSVEGLSSLSDKGERSKQESDPRWPFVTMLEAWNTLNGRPVQPEWLEEFVIRELEELVYTDDASTLVRLFANGRALLARCIEDGATLDDATDDLGGHSMTVLHAAFSEGHDTASTAQTLALIGDTDMACECWRMLFGNPFPAYI